MSGAESAETTEREVWAVRVGAWRLRLTTAGQPAPRLQKPDKPPVELGRVNGGSIVLLFASLGLAVAGQLLLQGEWLRLELMSRQIALDWLLLWHTAAGSALLALAGLLFALSVLPVWRLGCIIVHNGWAPLPAWRWVMLALSLLLAAGNMALFYGQGELQFHRWLWLCSMVLMVMAVAADGRGLVADLELRANLGAVLALLVVLLAAFWLRYDRLATLPYDLHGDMASYGLQVRDLMLGLQRTIFREGWADIPMVGFLPTLLSMRLFGNDIFGLNMTAVIGGVLSLLGFCLLLWRLSERPWLAVLATALAAINVAHIHFSRIAAYMDPWPFNLFGMFLLVDGVRSSRRLSFVLAGLSLGLGLQMYYSGRVIVFVIVGFALYLSLFHRRWITANWQGALLTLLAVIVALGPNLVYFAQNTIPLLQRSREVFLFYPAVMTHLQNKYGVDTAWAVLWEQTRRSLLMFHQTIDTSTQFGYPHPMFSTPVSPLIALGFACALAGWRRTALGFLLIFWSAMLVLGSILTGDAPFWPRLVGLTFAGAWFAALAVEALWLTTLQWLGQRRPELSEPNTARMAVAGLLFSLLTLIWITRTGWHDWRQYVETVQNNARSQALVGRVLSELPPTLSACAFDDPLRLAVRETAFLAYPRLTVDLPASAPLEVVEQCPGPPFVWVLAPQQQGQLDYLRRQWPDGVLADHNASNGMTIFRTYRVDAGRSTSRAVSQANTLNIDVNAPRAYNADGSAFEPQLSVTGNTASTVYEWDAGMVTVKGGHLQLEIGPLPGYDAALDYVRLVNLSGAQVRVEAEDLAVTTGDVFAPENGIDGHWWLQAYAPYSGGYGLVAQRQEAAPVLHMDIAAPDGDYRLMIGTFTGDPANGPFALGVRPGITD